MASISNTLQGGASAIIAIVGFGGIYLLYILIQYAIRAYRYSVLSRENGCKPPKRYPHRDPILGLDVLRENAANGKSGTFNECVKARYNKLGVNTYTSLFLGEEIIQTIEPENIKAVLATSFKDFELPPRRKEAMAPTFGHGIFTTDGEEWTVSRGLLRPNFSRSLVGDLDTFEQHISNMIEKIPKDGSTVDMQVLFFELTLDSGMFHICLDRSQLLTRCSYRISLRT